mmetsp:Transcript_14131/g.26568  ORF Transcript_14131/g.26568 Transcript_14131/m.26568 type:complete len:459 (-) Transcript_14131:39-1415(-)
MVSPVERDSLMSFAVAFVAHPENYAYIKQAAHSDLTMYVSAKLISPDSAENWGTLIDLHLDDQRTEIKRSGSNIFRAMLDIVLNINDMAQLSAAVLTSLDGALIDDKDLIDQLTTIYQHPRNPVDIVTGLKRLMINPSTDIICRSSACHILSLLMSEMVLRFSRNALYVSQETVELVNWIVAAVNDNSFPVDLAVYCMVPLFKVENLRFTFLERGGIRVVLIPIFNTKSGSIQPVYCAIYCLWMLSFDREALPVFTRTDYDLIRLVIRELRRTDKEKILRVALGMFKNLSDTNEDAITLMVEHKLLEVVDSISKRVVKDQEVVELLREVGDVLQSSIKLLSSYEKYLNELFKGQLVQGVTHTEAFWKENARQFESDRFINIGRLANLLNSADVETVVIALNDLGEFARFHPYGKSILDKLEVKEKVMTMLSREEKNVKEAALLCIQKLMIHNWQSLYS